MVLVALSNGVAAQCEWKEGEEGNANGTNAMPSASESGVRTEIPNRGESVPHSGAPQGLNCAPLSTSPVAPVRTACTYGKHM